MKVRSDWEITGALPKEIFLTEGDCDVRVTISGKSGEFLHLIPKIAVLGIG